MQLGFIGSGEITLSIVTGLSSSGVAPHSIWLSPRNSAVAHGLANRFHGISVASCNQEVLDHSATIVIAVRPSAARDVLSELAFRPDHRVISLVSALSLRSLSELVAPAVRIARAVPLPSAAKQLSPTAIYPPPIRWPLNSSLALELFFQLKGKTSSMQFVPRLRQLRPISHLMKRLRLGWSSKVFRHRKPETTLHDSFWG
jgi:pyrroline-5-carboxylate reductase